MQAEARQSAIERNGVRLGTTVHCLLLIFACFALTSAGYLSWLYNAADLVGSQTADMVSMVAGYLCQALGIGLFALAAKMRPALVQPKDAVVALALFVVFLAPATLVESSGIVIACGLALNLMCGVIAGFYLYELAAGVPANRRGIVFGGGYALASVAVWLFSLAGGPSFLQSGLAIGVYIALAAATALLFLARPASEGSQGALSAGAAPHGGGRAPAGGVSSTTLIVLACATIALVSLVKNLGFNFPTADVQNGVSIELSRVFYAVGLVAAGIVNDRSRKYGAICCLAALVVPFIMLALSGEPVSSMALWCFDYLLFGFFSVFRVVLFSDIATYEGALWFSGFGLAFGRVGDAAGTALFMGIGSTGVLVALAGVLFAASVFLLTRLYQPLFAPAESVEAGAAEAGTAEAGAPEAATPETAAPERDERAHFEDFAATYGLSAREREVLRLLIDERSNAEIAAELFVSDSTVKFHIRNLLKKTSCENRLELLALYFRS